MSKTKPVVQANVQVPLSDGINLATDIYRPEHEPLGTIMLRTPYGKGTHMAEGLAWVQHGFAFVVQDVRGRYDSPGIWQPYVHERADSLETLQWLATQQWAGGRLIVSGGSYAAYTAIAAALTNHPALRALIIQVPATGLYTTHFGSEHILQLANYIWWWMTNGDGHVQRVGFYERMLQHEPRLLHTLPVRELEASLWACLPGWQHIFEMSSDAFTQAELSQIATPTFHIGGWHDPFIAQTISLWETLGSALTPRPSRRLLIGPWKHELETHSEAQCGLRNYGSQSRYPLGLSQVRWLKQLLSDQHPAQNDLPIQIFLTGQNSWLRGQEWPQTITQSWYAHPRGQLMLSIPQQEQRATFTYDPHDPFPSRAQPVDRSDLAHRADAVRYITSPLPQAVIYIGSPRVTLYASTDAPGTDWVVSLHELWPDGRWLYLGHAILDAARSRMQQGLEFLPNTLYCYQLTLSPLAISIPTGHQLCLEITSSDFPQHARNLNTGQNRYTSSETRLAHQTVACGPETPTALHLPGLLNYEASEPV